MNVMLSTLAAACCVAVVLAQAPQTPSPATQQPSEIQLVISGERKAPEDFLKNGHTQLVYGKFYTSVTLPGGLEVDKVNCQLQDGVLDISIPVAEAMKPRQIPIQTAGQQKTIDQQKTISA